MLTRVPRLDSALRSALQRLENEVHIWREEPIRRVYWRGRAMRALRERQFQQFGQHSFVDRPAWLYGTKHISIGDSVFILEGAWLAVERMAWERTDPVMTLGNGVAARVGCTISAAESVVIEDNVGMAAYVTVIDSKHTWDGGHPNVLNNPIDTSPIHIGPSTFLSDRVTVAAGADIGEHCAIGANSVVSGKIPDFSIVVGNPGRVVGSTRT